MPFTIGNVLQRLCGSLVAVFPAVIFAAGAGLYHGGALAQVAVSASGQATTSIPITLPPGISGMTPNLYLQYADGGLNGPLGVGWSLQGVSMITRCPATRPVDGKAAPVEFKATDKLCLDGQRLIPVDSSGNATTLANGEANGIGTTDAINPGVYQEYRTEKDSFSRIRAYGASGGLASNGPAAFKVWTKAGQVYEYGTNPSNNANSRIYPFNATSNPPAPRSQVAVWAASRISDVVGNYIDFKYLSITASWGSGTTSGVFIGQEWGLIEVQYTGNGTQVPENKVVIQYEPRPTSSTAGFDLAETYQYGNKNVQTYRVKAIRSYINSPNPSTLGPTTSAIKVRAMLIGYEQSPSTGRSRIINVKECVDSNNTIEASCLPSRIFTYSNGIPASLISFSENTIFNSVLGTKKLTDSTGSYGVLTGDFNGDGLTDIIRYSYTASENEVWLSGGGGQFALATSFSLGTTQFFSADGCYSSIVADFNGDGLSDILRIKKTSCGVGGSVLLINQGNGTFTTLALPASMDLDQIKSNTSQTNTDCTVPFSAIQPLDNTSSKSARPAADSFNASAGPQPLKATGSGKIQPPRPNLAGGGGACIQYNRSIGKRFYILDLDGDGILDIVTTVAVPYAWNSGWGAIPSEQDLCWGSGSPSWSNYCSRVYKGSSTGVFTDMTNDATVTNNIRFSSLYANPPSRYGGSEPWSNPYWRMPDLADFDGDGLLDIQADYTGKWRSDGNFGFISSPGQAYNYVCPTAIDFNGDGRVDCLWPNASGTGQTLNISFGADASGNITQFNLTNAGDNLYGVDAQNRQTVGMVIEDFDGDGRQDILRWGPTPSDNGIYFSNGDGSFRARAGAGLTSITRPLNAVDGTASVVLGDFLGSGALQLLHMKHNPIASGDSATSNQLYSRPYSPSDVLATATSPTGLVTTIAPRVPLTNSGGRYINERGTPDAATAPVLDLQIPMYVIKSTTQDTGTSGTTSIATEYLYKGLKAERGGRGLLGFREVRQQNPAPGNKSITVVTENLLRFPYAGVAAKSVTYANSSAQAVPETLAGQMISRTTNIFCDKTAAAGAESSATMTAPCPTTAKIARPYLRQSVEEGWELGSSSLVLPTVTTVNSYNTWGDPTNIVVATVGNFDNSTNLPYSTSRTYTKATANTFCDPATAVVPSPSCSSGSTNITSPNDIRGEKWMLGRLTRSAVTNSAPDLRSVLTNTAGTAPKATALQGP